VRRNNQLTIEENILAFSTAGNAARADRIAVEEPLEIRLAYRQGHARLSTNVAVTMRTPGHDAELAVGFLFTEGIMADRGQLAGVGEVTVRNEAAEGNVVEVLLSDDVQVDLKKLVRNFYTTSSCGVCGKASIEAVRTQARFPEREDTFTIASQNLLGLATALRENQEEFNKTGCLHGAATFDSGGRIRIVREDVGRHNALDKLIGHSFLSEILPLRHHGLLLSGRAGFELVQKAWMAGIPLIASVGAPTSLAIELAREADITLIGFLKPDRFNVYCGEQRIVQ
jgi:FdhD protein